jgi:hypothetical protein
MTTINRKEKIQQKPKLNDTKDKLKNNDDYK